MNPIQTNQLLQSFFVDVLLSHPIDKDQDLFEAGILNSLSAVQLVAFLEETFHFKLTSADLTMEHFRSLDSITDLIKQKVTTIRYSS